MKREANEIKKVIKQLEKCCNWNGWDMKTTPAYKRLSKELEDALNVKEKIE